MKTVSLLNTIGVAALGATSALAAVGQAVFTPSPSNGQPQAGKPIQTHNKAPNTPPGVFEEPGYGSAHEKIFSELEMTAYLHAILKGENLDNKTFVSLSSTVKKDAYEIRVLTSDDQNHYQFLNIRTNNPETFADAQMILREKIYAKEYAQEDLERSQKDFSEKARTEYFGRPDYKTDSKPIVNNPEIAEKIPGSIPKIDRSKLNREQMEKAAQKLSEKHYSILPARNYILPVGGYAQSLHVDSYSGTVIDALAKAAINPPAATPATKAPAPM